MFGAFRPTSSLSVGLLWKNPWRLSGPRKLRHRRRLRRVDNVVTVLDTALQRRNALVQIESSSSATQSPASGSSRSSDAPLAEASQVTADELSQTAEGQKLLATQSILADPALKLHSGRGPKRGELLPPYPIGTESGLVGTIRTTGQVSLQRGTIKVLERWKADMPTESEMLPRDKYTMFDRKERNYRKSVHKGPKWTRTSQRLNPPGY